MSLIEIKKKLLMAQKGGADISELFNISLWTGTGAARTITTGIDSNEGSLVWIKRRSSTGNNFIFDTERGPTNSLYSDNGDAQSPYPNTLTAFSSTGYSLGNEAGVNGSGVTVSGFQFRQADTFFRIVKYTGNGSSRTLAHGLGAVPGFILIKPISASGNWRAYHRSRGYDNFGVLNGTGILATSGYFASEPDSSNMYLTSSSDVNQSGVDYIAYVFGHDSSANGLIQCGSYSGNGSSTGPSVSLGWKPQWLLIKSATSTSAWRLRDAGRGDGFVTQPNTSAADFSDSGAVVFGVDGFSIFTNAATENSSGQTYIYVAIREAA